jgi:hypothetical protein
VTTGRGPPSSTEFPTEGFSLSAALRYRSHGSLAGEGDRPVIIIAVVSKNPGRYAAMFGETVLVTSARQPFLDGCRALIAAGHAPDTIAVMRHAGSSTDSLRAKIGAAANLAADESATPRFRKWKPFDLDTLGDRAVTPRTARTDAAAV